MWSRMPHPTVLLSDLVGSGHHGWGIIALNAAASKHIQSESKWESVIQEDAS